MTVRVSVYGVPQPAGSKIAGRARGPREGVGWPRDGACVRPRRSHKGTDMTVAALYVETGGVYYGLPDVDPWDEARDARLYAGPWPVVAHPPCKSWSIMGQCRPEIVRGDDGGCFAAALAAVRAFGGVLEHPANTHAWRRFGLARPAARGWTGWIGDPGWTCEVDQFRYGHRANKRTWLYYVGDDPPAMDWSWSPRSRVTVHNDGGGGRDQRSKTPAAFRDVLLDMARSASRVAA